MIKLTLKEAARLTGAEGSAHEGEFQGLSIDTRKIVPGNLFIAIKGERVDGHDFLNEAKDKGAIAALVSHPVDSPLPQLIVKDITLALGQLGANWRRQFAIPFVAITGSNGKTTVKNMMAAIMKAACQHDESQVLATLGTLNNHLGLPLTLARLNKHHRYAAIEMGMNHFGEIDYLTRLTHPDVALITNAAAAHLEGVGDLAGVARAKAEIFNGLNANGIAILNRDDPYYDYWRTEIGEHHFLSFGFHPEANITAIQNEPLIVRTPNGDLPLRLPLLGKHNMQNALAAIAAAIALNLSLDAIQFGLENMQPAPGRLQKHTLENGVVIIDDTYNANPFSLNAAVETLSTFSGKKILVLGDMKELGEESKKLHRRAGENIRESGIDFLFTYGELSENTSSAFGEGAYHFNEQDKLLNALKPFLYNTTTILVKGSRSMSMEKVVQGLVQ